MADDKTAVVNPDANVDLDPSVQKPTADPLASLGVPATKPAPAAKSPSVLNRIRTAVSGDVEHRTLGEATAEENASEAAKGPAFESTRRQALAQLHGVPVEQVGKGYGGGRKLNDQEQALSDALQDPAVSSVSDILNKGTVAPETLSTIPVLHGALKFAGGLSSGGTVGLMAAGPAMEASPIISRAASTGFAAQQAKGAGEALANAYVDVKNKEYGKAADEATEGVLGGAFAAGAEQHATGGVREGVNRVREGIKERAAAKEQEYDRRANAATNVTPKAPQGQLAAAPEAEGNEVPDHITFNKSAGGKELRGPTTFGRTGGTFGTTVDRTFDVLRNIDQNPEPGGKVEAPEIKADGPEWDRVHSAIVDGKKVGSVGYHLDPEGEAQIYGSNVSADVRGKGIGQKLYAAAIEDARNAGATRITSDSTNITPDAARVWEKLKDKGLPVENITHANGKPGYQIDFENEPAPATQPEIPEAQHVDTLARRGELPNQKVNLSDSYGDTDGYVGGHLEYQGYPPRSTPEQIQQRYIENLGVTHGPALLDIPKDLLPSGADTHRVVTHEIGHAIVGHILGWEPVEIESHLHPKVRSMSAAATQMDNTSIGAVNNRISDDALRAAFESKIAPSLMAGGTAELVQHGTPTEKNSGMNGDRQLFRTLGEKLGYSDADLDRIEQEAINKAKEVLTHPAVRDIMSIHSATRPEGLSKTLHMDSDHLQGMLSEVREARGKNAQNDKSANEIVNGGIREGGNQGIKPEQAPTSRSEKVNESITKGNTSGRGEVNAATEPGKAGANPEGDLREGNGKTVPSGIEANKVKPKEDEVSPNTDLQASAQKYAKANGRPEINHEQVKADLARATEIANAYDAAKDEPNNPKVKAAYDALKAETKAQFHHLRDDLGLKFEPQAEDPYKSAPEMMNDIKQNNRLKVFTGSSTGPEHPLSEIDPETGESYNTLFRWVHDAMGHAAGGNDFSENGEKSATEAHAQMYSDKARPAMRAETEGQTSWFFHNPEVQAGRAKPGEFAPQKATILPDEGAYHPDLQKVVDKYGVSSDASKVANGASFITPDGKFIHLGSVEHPDAINHAGVGSGALDPRPEFIENTGAIRTRFSNDRAGRTLHVSVPADGVSPEQIDSLKAAVRDGLGKHGNIVMETAAVGSGTTERPIRFTSADFATANNIEPMLKEIGAHPESKNEVPSKLELNKKSQDWHETAGAAAAKQEAGGIDPATGKSDTKGIGTEIMPELRQPLDHAPTADDFKNFYDQHKDIFDQYPELRVGWDNNSAVPGGHEINVGAVGKDAARVAKKLDQKSAFDIEKGEIIPTKGEGLRTQFPNYPLEDRIKDLKGEPLSDIKDFEHLSKDVYDHLEPDERAYLHGNKLLQRNTMAQYHKIDPSVPETTNAMQAGAALGGWWQRYINVFHELTSGGAEQAAQTMGPSHAEVLKQWHAALSGNKSVQDANNLAWHSYADWLDAGKPTDRTSINDIIKKNAAQPEGSGKKGNAAISDTLNRKGKVVSPGLDTSKLFALVNSPEMRGERPFAGDAFNDDMAKNPLMGSTEGARKIPSMGATVAGKGNLNRLVIDAHIRDFYGRTNSGGPAAQYIADSAHLRQAAEALGLKGGEGQEQLWGTVLGLKTLLKEGLTPEEAGNKLNADVIRGIGKDYAEVIANDPEITKPGGLLDRLKEKYGIGRGSAGVSAANIQTPSTGTGEGKPTGSEAAIDKTFLSKTAQRIRGQIADVKIKKPGEEDDSFNFGANEAPKPAKKSTKKEPFNALNFLSGISGLNKPGSKK